MQTLLTEIITEHGDVVYNGDGYSEKWQIEAAERGLPNLKTTLDAIPELVKPEAVELFEKYGVFNERELHSRYEVPLGAVRVDGRGRGEARRWRSAPRSSCRRRFGIRPSSLRTSRR